MDSQFKVEKLFRTILRENQTIEWYLNKKLNQFEKSRFMQN